MVQYESMALIPERLPTLADAYDTWGPRLLAYAVALFRRRELAEEAVQNVFASLAARPALLAEARDPAAYLFTSVRREALALKEKNERFARLSETSIDKFLASTPEGELSDEECRHIERRLLEISDEQREVVVLKIWGGLTYPQISEATQTSVRTLESRFRSAIERLRDLLRHDHV
jgi:RNA polymerase sigma-70 factor (ECF subfamily)